MPSTTHTLPSKKSSAVSWRTTGERNARWPVSDFSSIVCGCLTTFVFAALDDDAFFAFTEAINGHFPETSFQFVGSLPSLLLSSFAAVLVDAAQQGNLEKSRDLDECWKAVVLARPALTELATLSEKIVRSSSAVEQNIQCFS